MEKRLYVSDLLVLNEAAKYGFAYTREVSIYLNLSVRRINGHFSKLEQLGFIERYGQRRCPFQCYRVPRALEAPVHGLLEHGFRLFHLGTTHMPCQDFTQKTQQLLIKNSENNQNKPKTSLKCQKNRFYFIFKWFSATRPSSYEQQRLPSFGGNASVPFDLKRWFPLRKVVPAATFWLPFDLESEDSLFEQLFEDLERFGVNYEFSSDFEVPVEFGLGDGFFDSEF